ncbi:MAG: hypothetical protein Q3997_01885 [Propionibacteriaceae bacterium]|nr:hypothetical protein [Propionibacteriaceae bacterium]
MNSGLLLLLMVLLVLAVVLPLTRRNKQIRAQRARQLPPQQWGQHPQPQQWAYQPPPPPGWGAAPPFAAALRATDEDITTFGDELRGLDLEVAGHTLDEAARQDYQRALDAYEHAKESLARVRSPQEIRHVTSILEDGRYAITCVKARVAGQPLPVKRPPCFFNPAHGPSAQNVSWAPPGGIPREIPACAADAERVLAGADPHIRTVGHGAARLPYWQDAAYAPYAQGYYSSWQADKLVRGLAVGTAVFAGLSILPHLAQGIGEIVEDILDDLD